MGRIIIILLMLTGCATEHWIEYTPIQNMGVAIHSDSIQFPRGFSGMPVVAYYDPNSNIIHMTGKITLRNEIRLDT